MKLSEVKKVLKNAEKIGFQLPNGELVPSHFHVTEVGKITKNFIDCGGVVRNESVVSFQLWEDSDYDHRLHPEKLVQIIELSERVLALEDAEVEVEYQGETIGKYHLDFDGNYFLLKATKTDCLAKDACGITVEKPKLKVLNTSGSSCTPNSGCC